LPMAAGTAAAMPTTAVAPATTAEMETTIEAAAVAKAMMTKAKPEADSYPYSHRNAVVVIWIGLVVDVRSITLLVPRVVSLIPGVILLTVLIVVGIVAINGRVVLRAGGCKQAAGDQEHYGDRNRVQPTPDAHRQTSLPNPTISKRLRCVFQSHGKIATQGTRHAARQRHFV